MIKGIIFDLGHTLMEFTGVWEEVEAEGKKRMAAYLKKKKLNPSEEMAQDFWQNRQNGYLEADKNHRELTAEQALVKTLEKFNVKTHSLSRHWRAEGSKEPHLNGKMKPLIQGALKAYFSPEEENWRLFHDAYVVLKHLKKEGYLLGLISNVTDVPFFNRCLKKLKLTPYFNPAVPSAGHPVRKPHPEIFLHIARTWGINPSEIAMVGDLLYFDIYGAHQAGMKGVWLSTNHDKAYKFTPEELKDDPRLVPEATIYSLTEILMLVKNL
jgi:putative hydrolase of the HAD superfamily